MTSRKLSMRKRRMVIKSIENVFTLPAATICLCCIIPVGGPGCDSTACGTAAAKPFVRTRFMSSPEHWITSMYRFLLLMNMNFLCLESAATSAACSEFIWMKASPEGVPWNDIGKTMLDPGRNSLHVAVTII